MANDKKTIENNDMSILQANHKDCTENLALSMF